MFTDDQEIKIAEYNAKMTEADAKLAELKQQHLQRNTETAEFNAKLAGSIAKLEKPLAKAEELAQQLLQSSAKTEDLVEQLLQSNAKMAGFTQQDLQDKAETAELKQQSYAILKQLAGEELGSSFQKAMDENNIDDLKELLPKISSFIYSVQVCLNPKVLYVLIKDKPEEIIKVILEHPDMLSNKILLAKMIINKENMNSDIFGSIAEYTKGLKHFKECKYMLDEKSIREIAELDPPTSINLLRNIYLNSEQPQAPLSEALINYIQSQEITAVTTLLSLLYYLTDVENDHKHLYEGIQTGNVEIVSNVLRYLDLDQEAFNIAMKKGGEIKEYICRHDKLSCNSKFSKAFLANEVSLEHNETDVMGGLESHPE